MLEANIILYDIIIYDHNLEDKSYIQIQKMVGSIANFSRDGDWWCQQNGNNK